jgi:hypothetical protein
MGHFVRERSNAHESLTRSGVTNLHRCIGRMNAGRNTYAALNGSASMAFSASPSRPPPLHAPTSSGSSLSRLPAEDDDFHAGLTDIMAEGVPSMLGAATPDEHFSRRREHDVAPRELSRTPRPT